MSYIIFDVETTGLPKNYRLSPKVVDNWPYIVQFSWIIVNDYKKTERSFIIKPDGYVIPDESIRIHQISNEKAIKEGILLKEVLEKFQNDCENINSLIAHNLHFDKSVILASCYRLDYKLSSFINKKLVCTMKSTTDLCKIPGKYGYKYPRLEELHIFLFGKVPDGVLHDSLVDSRITLKCYEELLRKSI